jgi:deoxyribodipyrimidine photo-lyase
MSTYVQGAAYFEKRLVDYDVTQNWGNWHALAALNGGRVNKFNILKQAQQYDPEVHEALLSSGIHTVHRT